MPPPPPSNRERTQNKQLLWPVRKSKIVLTTRREPSSPLCWKHFYSLVPWRCSQPVSGPTWTNLIRLWRMRPLLFQVRSSPYEYMSHLQNRHRPERCRLHFKVLSASKRAQRGTFLGWGCGDTKSPIKIRQKPWRWNKADSDLSLHGFPIWSPHESWQSS